jgi:hypothetical protein
MILRPPTQSRTPGAPVVNAVLSWKKISDE